MEIDLNYDEINIEFDGNFTIGDIITDDPEVGQQLLVTSVNNNIHTLKLVLNNKEDVWIKKDKGTNMICIAEYTNHPTLINLEDKVLIRKIV